MINVGTSYETNEGVYAFLGIHRIKLGLIDKKESSFD
jgi:hypothetical protein